MPYTIVLSYIYYLPFFLKHFSLYLPYYILLYYICLGNIPPQIGDTELVEFFGNAMLEAGVIKDNNPNPIVSVQMNHEKSFAFVEFTNPEDANAGMNFDGM